MTQYIRYVGVSGEVVFYGIVIDEDETGYYTLVEVVRHLPSYRTTSPDGRERNCTCWLPKDECKTIPLTLYEGMLQARRRQEGVMEG